MREYTFKRSLDIPVGHSLLNYGPIISKDSNEKAWAFAIGFNDEYSEPKTLKECPEEGYSYEFSIIVRRSEQAEAYSYMFSKMAEEMKVFEKEET